MAGSSLWKSAVEESGGRSQEAGVRRQNGSRAALDFCEFTDVSQDFGRTFEEVFKPASRHWRIAKSKSEIRRREVIGGERNHRRPNRAAPRLDAICRPASGETRSESGRLHPGRGPDPIQSVTYFTCKLEMGSGRCFTWGGPLHAGPVIAGAAVAGGAAGGVVRRSVDRGGPTDPDIAQPREPALRVRTAGPAGGAGESGAGRIQAGEAVRALPAAPGAPSADPRRDRRQLFNLQSDARRQLVVRYSRGRPPAR